MEDEGHSHLGLLGFLNYCSVCASVSGIPISSLPISQCPSMHARGTRQPE